MPNYHAAKLFTFMAGVDLHAGGPPLIPPIPVHPYVGVVFLWWTPQFPSMNVMINGLPACSVGAMGYSIHFPQVTPVNPTNATYWTRWMTNILMGAVLIALTLLANMAIATIGFLLPKGGAAEGFLKDVTGIDTSKQGSYWQSVIKNITAWTKFSTWGKLLMPPVPYPGAQGSVSVGSPSVQVNGGALAFCVCPFPTGTSCSDIPVIPNAFPIGFSTVLVGVSYQALLRAIAVHGVQAGITAGIGAGVKAGLKGAGKGHP